MTTDNEMDDMLRGAGQRWRAANPGPAAAPDFDVAVAAPHRRARWLTPVAAAAAVVLLAGGTAWFTTRSHHPNHSTAASGAVDDLTSTTWHLAAGTLSPARSGVTGFKLGGGTALDLISLTFASDGSVTGGDGANTFSGPSTITDTTITFGPIYTTAMGSTNSAFARISAVVDPVMQGEVSWAIDDSGSVATLTIVHAGVGTLTYTSAVNLPPQANPKQMIGTWQLMEIDQTSGDAGSSSGSSTGFGDLLVIEADNTFKVQHRCYADVGDVTIGAKTATWSHVHLAGAIPCPAIPGQKDEQTRNAVVDGVLSGSTTWSVDSAGHLTITKGGDSIVYARYDTPAGAVQAGNSSSPTK